MICPTEEFAMSQVSTIGILGGMGPAATNHMASLITQLTSATNDQEHIPVISFNNSQIPNRVDAILLGGPSPVPELVRTARVLEKAGADFLIMPCNTAHHFIEEIRSSISAPVLHMVSECAAHMSARGFRRIGILASSAAVAAEVFRAPFKSCGIELMYPSPSDQAVVMDAIFGEYGIKAGHMHRGYLQLKQVAANLAQYQCEAILAGCTDVSVSLSGSFEDLEVEVIDPMYVLAKLAINLALQGFCGDKLGPVQTPFVISADIVVPSIAFN
jgi:aspartate racemase